MSRDTPFRNRLPGGADSGWLVPTYNANWSDAGAGFQTRRCRKIGDKVRLEMYPIRATSSSGASAVICTLPTGFWPTTGSAIVGTAHNSAGTIAGNIIYVDTTGQVVVSLSVVVGTAIPIFADFYV